MSNLAEAVSSEEQREYIYKKIDRSITFSFVGGVVLGMSTFFYTKGFGGTALGFMVGSLIIFFMSRFNGLRFLFDDDGED